MAAQMTTRTFFVGAPVGLKHMRSRASLNTTVVASSKKGVNSVKNDVVKENVQGVSSSMEKKGLVDSQGGKGKAEEFAKHLGFLPDGPQITKEDITKAQKMWGDAVVTIGATEDKEAAVALAEEVARTAYSFNLGAIQFKPTLASEIPFRQSIEGAISYFVGGNKDFKEDKGFALRPWTKVRFENDTVKIKGNIAIAMGHYHFTDTAGEETKAEYTKGYVKTADDRVLIFLQDSSLPYSPE